MPSKRWTPSQRIARQRSITRLHSSGSSRSASSIDPTTSTNSTVTSLRSPSNARPAASIRAASRSGVHERRSPAVAASVEALGAARRSPRATSLPAARGHAPRLRAGVPPAQLRPVHAGRDATRRARWSTCAARRCHRRQRSAEASAIDVVCTRTRVSCVGRRGGPRCFGRTPCSVTASGLQRRWTAFGAGVMFGRRHARAGTYGARRGRHSGRACGSRLRKGPSAWVGLARRGHETPACRRQSCRRAGGAAPSAAQRRRSGRVSGAGATLLAAVAAGSRASARAGARTGA